MNGDEGQVLLTVKEAAALARRSRSQIYSKLRAGELPAVRSLGGVLIHKARFLELLRREAECAATEQGSTGRGADGGSKRSSPVRAGAVRDGRRPFP